MNELELRTFASTEDVVESKDGSMKGESIKRRVSVARSSPRNIKELRKSMRQGGTAVFMRPRHHSQVGWHELMEDFVGSKIELRKGEQRRESWVLYADTWTFKIWNLIVFLSLVYTTIFTPIQAALWKDSSLSDPSEWPLVFAADRMVDVVFIIDIIVTFRIAIPDDSGHYWFDAGIVSERYRTSIRFVVDIIAAIPWEFALAIAEKYTAERLVRLVKLLRVHRLWMILGQWERNINVQNGMFQFITTSVGFFMCVHLVACGWIMSAYTVEDESLRWINEESAQNDNSKMYAISVYWALMTLSTIGYGDVTPTLGNNGEMWYTIVIFVLGAVAYSYVNVRARHMPILSLAHGITLEIHARKHRYVLSKIIEWTQDKAKKEFEEAIFDLDAYMRELQFNPDLVDRIWRYCFFVREKRLLGRKSRALSILSPSLRKEAAVAAYFSALDHNPLIEHLICSKEAVHILQLITEISTRLQIEFFGPDEMLCNFDDKVNKAMYMVRDGRILLKNGTTNKWKLLQGYKTSLLRKRHEKEVTESPTRLLHRAMSSSGSFSEPFTSTFSEAHNRILRRKNSQQDIRQRKLPSFITQVPSYSFGESNIVFKHTSCRFRATSMSFCNVLRLSQSDMEQIWTRFPEAHRIAKVYCMKHRLQDLARSGQFVKWLRSISGTFGLQKGVRVKIVKPGSRFAGCLAIITDMNWSGRIKVRMKADGAVKSYLPNHLQVLKLKERKTFAESKDGELLLTELEKTTEQLLKQQRDHHERHISNTEQILREQKEKDGQIILTELEKSTSQLLKQQRDNHDNQLTKLEKTTEQLLKQQRDNHDNHLFEFEKTTEKILKNGQKHQHHTVQEFYKLVKRQSTILESVLRAMADQKTQMKERMSVLSKDLIEIKSKVNALLEEDEIIG